MNPKLRIPQPDSQQIKTLSMSLVLVGCISLGIWVSLDKFSDMQDSHDQIHATIMLDQEVSRLQSQYREANHESLKTDLEHTDQLLIQNVTHLAQWAQGLQQQGEQWDLQMHYRLVKTRQTPAPVEGLAVIPIDMQVSSQGEQSGYRNYLHFLHALEQSGPRIDINEVTVTGDGEKATLLTVGFSVWMKTIDSVEL